ncbi:glutathione synthetase-like isoform X1 [Amblyraja radiata]|uniref:glutathione synthetase-like isoform X1 n=2 Tax=Amblyraja radiata TaxID=386614 RepID=UPI0014029962|nr:glutathione synthetase-like isoform X1 [Amblyraja radiata]
MHSNSRMHSQVHSRLPSLSVPKRTESEILIPVVPDEVLLNSGLIQHLALNAKDAALLYGVLMRTKEDPNSSETISYAPFTLFPSPVPTRLFNQAFEVQQDFNLLVDKISMDSEFLKNSLASTAEADEFTARLFNIYTRVLDEGIAQPITLGVNRSDYMFDKRPKLTATLKQVEINTIAASYAGLAARVPEVHRQVMNVWGKPDEAAKIMSNKAVKGICKGIARAWHLYGSSDAAVLFLVEKFSRNIFDQRCLEMELWKKNVRVIRRQMYEIYERGTLDDNKKLFVDGNEVAVAYFRTGYSPDDYFSEECWIARLMIERSMAIKCPNIATHLVGTKKIQQELVREGVLEKFLPEDPAAVERIRATFVGLYSIDEGPEGDEIIAKALADPESYVLKPQREGGGNNIFGEELRQVLGGIKDKASRSAYILMDRIKPQVVKNYLLQSGASVKLSECVVELGVFGVYIRNCNRLSMNLSAGHLLRTKRTEFADGGVSAGVAVLDTPYLI